jgi:hypothetical protein
MERFYREIGDTLKQNYPGTQAWFITANLEALKFVAQTLAKNQIVQRKPRSAFGEVRNVRRQQTHQIPKSGKRHDLKSKI